MRIAALMFILLLATPCARVGVVGSAACEIPSSALGIFTCPTGRPDLAFCWAFDEGTGGETKPWGRLEGAGWTAGTEGAGLKFGGDGDRVSVESSAGMDFGAGFTVSAWVRLQGADRKAVRTIIDKGGNPAWWIENGDVSINLKTSGNPAAGVLSFNTDLEENRWYHLAFAYDGRRTSLFVNGSLFGTDNRRSGSLLTNGENLSIGNGGHSGSPLRGVMDRLEIYSRALPEEELRAVFREESPEILRVGLLADVHWGGVSGREGLSPREKTRAKLESFIVRMNTWKADLVVELGDLADSWADSACTDAPILDRLCSEEEMVNRLTEVNGLLKAGLKMPLYYVWGNHEMKDPDWGYDRVLAPLGFGTLEDTWYAFDRNGITFIVMNTAHKEEVRTHIIPDEELVWLEKTLRETENPTFVFCHVPFIEVRTGPADAVYDTYDQPVNEEKARALIEADGQVVAVFFGHMHHAKKWRRLRQEEVNGVTYYHITSPHSLMGDESATPWGELTMYDGWYRLQASYASDEYPTEWIGSYPGSLETAGAPAPVGLSGDTAIDTVR